MPTFTYIGEDAHGNKVTEQVTADDRFAVYELARENGHTVVSVTAKEKWSVREFFNTEKINYYLSRISEDELVMITRNLGSMMRAGLPVTRALSVIERQSHNPRLKGVMTSVIARISKGDSLHDALADFPRTFDDLYVSMVRAGEESGKLTDTLQTLSEQIERSANLRKKIKGAMIYPAIVISVMFIIGILMMIYVMPQITGVFEKLDVDLPLTTVILIALSKFLTEYTLLSLGGMVAAILGVVYFKRTSPGKRFFSWLFLHLPIIGTMVKETNSARTARTLSSLLDSGVDVVRSLAITKDVVQNVYFKRVIHEASVEVEKGTAMSSVFIAHEELYPVLVGEMILVGEETGQISGMLRELAEFYENEVERKTKDLSTIIEPVLMVVIGGGVGFFALAMIAPIYSISESI